MRWSKVRKQVEESFAPSVRGRVSVHSTWQKVRVPYRCDCGWGWIAIDGKPFVYFDSHLSWEKYQTDLHEVTVRGWTIAVRSHPAVDNIDRDPTRLVERGEFSRRDWHHACWKYLHSSVNNSLASDNPLIASLAVLNARVGRHRLGRLSLTRLHPLTRALLEFRMEAEKEGIVQRAGQVAT